jgi:DNA-binding transcriptional regulator YiaG
LPDENNAIRATEHASQPGLARYLNVPKKLLSESECCAKKPVGPALRLLSISQRIGLGAVKAIRTLSGHFC